VEALRRFLEAGGGALDPDTTAGPQSWEAALRSAGAGLAAVEALRAASHDTTAFLAVRPPGHHALANRAMGFCLFNNVAVTARSLTEGGERVAIVDWDVHHGNGTQALFAADPRVLYISAHQWPFYPGTGAVDEVGEGEAEGTVINVPFPAATAGDAYRELFQGVLVPVMKGFAPHWVLVSAGYDAHENDPMAEMRLTAADYSVMAAALLGVVPPHRVVFFLEGGYHLAAMTESVAATLQGVAGLPLDLAPGTSPASSFRVLDEVAATAERYWKL
jgi:acetoin utilization deacetylase AcuC-like enzyme